MKWQGMWKRMPCLLSAGKLRMEVKMELQTISAFSIVGMILTLAISIGVPIALLVLIHKKKGAGISCFFLGASVFFVAAVLLEQMLHMVVLTVTGDMITGNIGLYGLYGGLAAALFEETGRFVAMKYFMKKKLNTANALMYGAGHGGFEAILIVGLTYLNNVLISIMINMGTLEAGLNMLDEETKSVTMESLSALWTTPATLFYLAGIERIFAIAIQIALSVLMYLGVQYGKGLCIAGAYGLHFLVDFITVIMAERIGTAGTEGCLLLLTTIIAVVVYRIWKKLDKMPKLEKIKP